MPPNRNAYTQVQPCSHTPPAIVASCLDLAQNVWGVPLHPSGAGPPNSNGLTPTNGWTPPNSTINHLGYIVLCITIMRWTLEAIVLPVILCLLTAQWLTIAPDTEQWALVFFNCHCSPGYMRTHFCSGVDEYKSRENPKASKWYSNESNYGGEHLNLWYLTFTITGVTRTGQRSWCHLLLPANLLCLHRTGKASPKSVSVLGGKK